MSPFGTAAASTLESASRDRRARRFLVSIEPTAISVAEANGRSVEACR